MEDSIEKEAGEGFNNQEGRNRGHSRKEKVTHNGEDIFWRANRMRRALCAFARDATYAKEGEN